MDLPVFEDQQVNEDEGSPSQDGVNYQGILVGKSIDRRMPSGCAITRFSFPPVGSPLQDWPETVQVKPWSMATKEIRKQDEENTEMLRP